MRNMLLIARREYMEQIKGRAFRLSTIGVPALFALVLWVAYVSGRQLGIHKHVVIVSADRALAEAVRSQLLGEKGKRAMVEVAVPSGPDTRAGLIDSVAGKTIDGFLWIDDAGGAAPTASYTSKTAGDFMTATRLKEALDDGFVAEHLVATGMDQENAKSVVEGIEVETYQVRKSVSGISVVKVNAQASFWKGYVMAFLLSITTLIYGMNVARSIIQEKTSRIFEVMLATAKPSDMLAGKLIGVGSVGLTQIGIWLVAGVAIVGSPMAAAMLSGRFAIHFTWIEGLLFPVYFLLGYLLYSALFAGLAATCETEQELQMYMPLAALPTWLSFSLVLMVMNDSNSFWSVTASLFPPTAPIIMFLRMAAEIPPLWQFAVSIGLLVLSIWITLEISSRLYRVGILMYGKRATLPELLRWLRYS
jgi:ABC-2 type transport system permease protein